MVKRLYVSALLAAFANFGAPSAFAGDMALTVYGGALMEGHFPGSAMIPFGSGFDERYLAGVAASREFKRFSNGITLGAEAGLAARLGPDTSFEAWAGASIGHTGFTFGAVNIAPSLVVGLSAVNKTVGIERRREEFRGGDGRVLFYLGPEVAFTHQSHPNVSLVYRIHHRSGAWNTLGGMRDAYNANIIGLRYKF